jgi:hypothetical protein
VTKEPCVDGGDQILILLILKDPLKDDVVVLTTVPIVPAAHKMEFAVRMVAAPEEEVYLNV